MKLQTLILKHYLKAVILPILISQVVLADEPVRAVTRPSKDVTLGFLTAGRIAEIHVYDGYSVEAGQLLARLNDKIPQARLERLRALSEDDTQVQAAKARWQQKCVDLDRYKQAAESNAATELELEHARLDAKIAEWSLKVAQFQHNQDIKKYQEAKIEVEQMKLKSPVDGRVEKVFLEEGEAVDALADVVRIVDTDPLWINAHVPVARAAKLSVGGNAEIRFPQGLTSTGKIIYISTVADANTLTVRVRVPNKSNRPAGEQVYVSFPENQPSKNKN